MVVAWGQLMSSQFGAIGPVGHVGIGVIVGPGVVVANGYGVCVMVAVQLAVTCADTLAIGIAAIIKTASRPRMIVIATAICVFLFTRSLLRSWLRHRAYLVDGPEHQADRQHRADDQRDDVEPIANLVLHG